MIADMVGMEMCNFYGFSLSDADRIDNVLMGILCVSAIAQCDDVRKDDFLKFIKIKSSENKSRIYEMLIDNPMDDFPWSLLHDLVLDEIGGLRRNAEIQLGD